jgi:predicted RNase H-like nuclease (RuvC/YqgF family)
MTLEEILAEVGEEKAGVIKAAIDAEKARGIDASRKKGDEVKRFMTEANKLKDALKALDVDPESDMDTQLESLKQKIAVAKAGGGSNEEVKALQRSLKTLETKFAETERKEAETRKKYESAKLTEALTKAFGDTLIGVDQVVENLILKGKAKLIDENSVVFVDGETETELSAGVEAFKKSRPDLVKINGKPGSGGTPPSGAPGQKKITTAQFETMSVKERAAFFADGGTVAT